MPLQIVRSSTKRSADRIVVYGTEGIGKSLWAKGAPKPLFGDTEDSLAELDVDTVPIHNFADAKKFVREFPYPDFQTAVFDTTDILDIMMQQDLCDRREWRKGMETPGYGKGWVAHYEQWDEFLDELKRLSQKGVEVIMVAHSKVGSFNNPDGANYSRFEPRLKDEVAAKIKAWASQVFFATYEEMVVTAGTKNDPTQKGKVVTGGKRIMYTVKKPSRDAKNRYNLPERIPLTHGPNQSAYNVFAEHRDKFWKQFGQAKPVPAESKPQAEVSPAETASVGQSQEPVAEKVTDKETIAAVDSALSEPIVETPNNEPPVISKADVGKLLSRYMKETGEKDVRKVKDQFYPFPLTSLDEASPEQLAEIAAEVQKKLGGAS